MLKLFEEVRLQKNSWDIKMTELPVAEKMAKDPDNIACHPMVRFWDGMNRLSGDEAFLEIRKWGDTTLGVNGHQPSMLIASATLRLEELTQLHLAIGQAIETIQHNKEEALADPLNWNKTVVDSKRNIVLG